MIPWVRCGLTFANVLLRRPPVRCVASAKLRTDYGEFDIHAFRNAFSGETHVALVRGQIGCLRTKKEKLGHVLSSV